MEPAVGKRAVYIGAYQGDVGGSGTEGTNTVQPRVMVVERDGSMPSDAQLLIGKVGDTLWWLRIAPTGRVWALTISYLEDGEAVALYLVAEDTALGPVRSPWSEGHPIGEPNGPGRPQPRRGRVASRVRSPSGAARPST